MIFKNHFLSLCTDFYIKLFLTEKEKIKIINICSFKINESNETGEVSEWLKEHAWKVCICESISRVRIPSSPL